MWLLYEKNTNNKQGTVWLSHRYIQMVRAFA